MPPFDAFRRAGHITLPTEGEEKMLFKQFREDPVAHTLADAVGGVSRFSRRPIAGFGYDDCPGHSGVDRAGGVAGGERARIVSLCTSSPISPPRGFTASTTREP